MATKTEKTERRWRIVVAILVYNAIWGLCVFWAFMEDKDVSKLDVITGALFGSSIIGIIGNWFSKPTEDDNVLPN